MNEQWRVLAVYFDPMSAAVVEGLLRGEGLEVRVLADEPVPGLMKSFTVLVPPTLIAHAERICSQAALSDEEWSQYHADVADEDDAKRSP